MQYYLFLKKKLLTTTIGVVGAYLALASGVGTSQAAIITIDPLNASVNSGATFDLRVIGQGFDAGTIGGGFSLAWDPNLLTLQNQNLTFAGDQFVGQDGIVDNAAGTLSNADVTSFNGVAGPDFEIAVLTFTAMSFGLSPADIVVGVFDGGSRRLWADAAGFTDTNPTFISGTVRVNPVPVPAAVWLFGSGLLGLIGIARRGNITQAV